MNSKKWTDALPLTVFGLACGTALGYMLAGIDQEVNWESVGSMMQGAAALLATFAAAWGVNRWQQELRYKRDSELAEKILVSVEGLNRALRDARTDPLEFEIDDRVPEGSILTSQSYEYRLNRLTDGGHEDEISALRDRVFAIFGPKHANAIDALLGTTTLIRSMLSECARTAKAVDAGVYPPTSLEELSEIASTVLSIDKHGRDMTDVIGLRVKTIRGLFSESI